MAETAVLVIDMLNDYRHADGELLAEHVSAIIEPLAGLIGAARGTATDLIYINDNRGDFSADFANIVVTALRGAHPELVTPILPRPDDRIMVKVRHSAFYATPLEYLLNRLATRRIVLTGQVTEQCILYSALDGYVRHFDVTVALDAIACIDPELGRAALAMMHRNMRAELLPAAKCLA